MKLFRRTGHIVSMITLLSAGAFAQPQSQPQPNKSKTASAQQPSAPDPRGSEQLPIFVRVLPANKTDAEAAQDQAESKEQSDDRWWTKRLAIGTLIVGILQVVAISFQVRLAFRQNKIVLDQNNIMRAQSKVMDCQLRATSDSADAARTSANVAKETMLNAQRAYLVHDHWDVHKYVDDSGKLVGYVVTAAFKNCGVIPALRASVNSSRLRVGEHAPEDFVHPVDTKDDETLQKLEQFGATVGPNVLIRGAREILTLEGLDRLMERPGRELYLHAYIRYQGHFYDDTIRHTQICCRVKLIADHRAGVDNPFDFPVGPAEHNYAT